MNIFFLDADPEKAALWLDDLRTNKMILECGQMISTYIHLTYTQKEKDKLFPVLYKPTHVNHPCNIAIRKNENNLSWLLEWFYFLSKKKNFKHKTCEKLDYVVPRLSTRPLNSYHITLPNCTPYKTENNTIKAYRKYMVQDKWGPKTSWRLGEKPEWIKDYE